MLEADKDKAMKQFNQQLMRGDDKELKLVNHKLVQCRIDYIK